MTHRGRLLGVNSNHPHAGASLSYGSGWLS